LLRAAEWQGGGAGESPYAAGDPGRRADLAIARVERLRRRFVLSKAVASAQTAAMRLFLLTALTMVAFAANSVLNRLALAGADIGPAEFAAIRLAAGAVVLLALVLARGGGLPAAGWRVRAVGAGRWRSTCWGFPLPTSASTQDWAR
jgi:hypothetical protein